MKKFLAKFSAFARTSSERSESRGTKQSSPSIRSPRGLRPLANAIVFTAAITLLAAACNKPASVNNGQNDQTQTSTTSDQTANWKTYTNSKYGFEFKYPKDMVVVQEGATRLG